MKQLITRERKDARALERAISCARKHVRVGARSQEALATDCYILRYARQTPNILPHVRSQIIARALECAISNACTLV